MKIFNIIYEFKSVGSLNSGCGTQGVVIDLKKIM